MTTKPVTTAVIADYAFMSILVSAVEAFPSKYRPDMFRKPKGVSAEGEVHGLLFGQRIEKKAGTVFNVTLAVPNQIVYSRSADEVTPSAHHVERIRELVEFFPGLQFLGFFHSHPYAAREFNKKTSVEYSEDDVTSALDASSEFGEDLIEVIFGLTCLERRSKIQPQFIANNLITNCCDIYKYSLACYLASVVQSEEDGTLVDVDNLICPMAINIR